MIKSVNDLDLGIIVHMKVIKNKNRLNGKYEKEPQETPLLFMPLLLEYVTVLELVI